MLFYSIVNEQIHPHTYSGKIFNDQPPEPRGGFAHKPWVTANFTGIGVGVYFLLLASCPLDTGQGAGAKNNFERWTKKPLFRAARKKPKK
jgi:hypothetical protein